MSRERDLCLCVCIFGARVDLWVLTVGKDLLLRSQLDAQGMELR